MFSTREKLYIKCNRALGRWKTARMALIGYTTVPAGVSVWEIIMSQNLKLLLPYLLFVGMTVICQIVCAGKVHHYQAIVDLLEQRLDLPPPSTEELKD